MVACFAASNPWAISLSPLVLVISSSAANIVVSFAWKNFFSELALEQRPRILQALELANEW